MPECLKCGYELKFADIYNMEVNGDVVLVHIIGYCPNCGTDHKWKEVYQFERFQDLKIEND